MRRFFCILVLLAGCRLFAQEVIPPAPAAYFNDYANVVSSGTASQLNQTLENFERQTSEQILVAVYPKMQSDSSVEDYTVRVARSWRAGQKDKNNGAVLFVFVQDHKMFLQVGYGLEGVLPDALCKRIISEQITPRFKAGDFDGGLTAGVQSIIAATKSEYKGTGTDGGRRAHLSHDRHAGEVIKIVIIVIVVVIIIVAQCAAVAIDPVALITGVAAGRAVVSPVEVAADSRWRRIFGGGGRIFRRRRQLWRRRRGRELVIIMHPKTISKHLQHDDIVAAIHDAEQKTSGQIRVSISHRTG